MSSQVTINSSLNLQENNYENTCQYITARKPGDLHRHLQGVLENLNARAY